MNEALPRCETCKHWKPSDDPTGRVEGTCGRIGGQDACIYPKALPSGELAQAQATYDWTGVFLQTRATFGCVLHEANSAKATTGLAAHTDEAIIAELRRRGCEVVDMHEPGPDAGTPS